MDESLLGKNSEYRLKVVGAELLTSCERQLERRALDVIDEDVQVVRIDERALGRRIEKVRGIPHDELVERRTARHHHGRRPAGAASRSSGTLPRRGDRAWIPGQHRHVEGADVDAELQSARGHDGADGTFAQPLFDFATTVREISAAVATNSFGRSWRSFEVVLQIGRQDLGRKPALREHDQLEIPFQELRSDAACFAQIRAADPELMVHDRRIHEYEILFPAWCATPLDEL